MLIGVPQESASGEPRVAATRETADRPTAPGHTATARSGTGVATRCINEAGVACGAEITVRVDGGARARNT
ncbi:MAG: hypothetical protein OEU93_00970 [Rubrivivax sp.]|nr:hypothetical protein [Rubrivivax sp.]